MEKPNFEGLFINNTIVNNPSEKIYFDELPKELSERNWTDWVFKWKLGAFISNPEIPESQPIRTCASFGNIEGTAGMRIEIRTTKGFVKSKMLDELIADTSAALAKFRKDRDPEAHQVFTRRLNLTHDILKTGPSTIA